MFNYIASALMGYLLVNVLREPGQMNAETPPFRDTALVPQFHELLTPFRHHLAGHAVQPLVPAGARRCLGGLAADLAHAARL